MCVFTPLGPTLLVQAGSRPALLLRTQVQRRPLSGSLPGLLWDARRLLPRLLFSFGLCQLLQKQSGARDGAPGPGGRRSRQENLGWVKAPRRPSEGI